VEVEMIARIQFYIFIIALLGGALTYWKHDIQQKALLEYNQKQLEQAAKDREEFQQKMSEIQDKQRTVEEDLANQNSAVSQKLNTIDDYLTSSDTIKKDKQSSDILKKTITELSGDRK
jgi:septal ring factor EnvC (AmiA/AmiB activator)